MDKVKELLDSSHKPPFLIQAIVLRKTPEYFRAS